MTTATQKTLNVRLPSELASTLESLTKVTGRTKSALTVEALEEYLKIQAWQIGDIKRAIAEADRGEFAIEEDVTNFFAKYDC